jgi:hypothetical protein
LPSNFAWWRRGFHALIAVKGLDLRERIRSDTIIEERFEQPSLSHA